MRRERVRRWCLSFDDRSIRVIRIRGLIGECGWLRTSANRLNSLKLTWYEFRGMWMCVGSFFRVADGYEKLQPKRLRICGKCMEP